MSIDEIKNDDFNKTKNEILKHKYEYMLMYLNDTQKRVKDSKNYTLELTKRL